MNKAASVKQKLKNISKSSGRLYNELLQMYALERVICRISMSEHNDKFILKGGILLYGIYEGDYPRATRDLDLLGININNDLDEINNVFKDILSIDINDGVIFDIDSIKTKEITKDKKYPGINISIMGFMERTKLLINIDVGFGDKITPSKVKMYFPVLIDDDEIIVNTYNKETIIAEKFEAIVSLGYLNSRYKDLFDIYILINSFDFELSILKEAIFNTFKNRKTNFNVISIFEEDYIKNSDVNKGWNIFINKQKGYHELELEIVIKNFKIFFNPILKDENEYKTWNNQSMRWI